MVTISEACAVAGNTLTAAGHFFGIGAKFRDWSREDAREKAGVDISTKISEWEKRNDKLANDLEKEKNDRQKAIQEAVQTWNEKLGDELDRRFTLLKNDLEKKLDERLALLDRQFEEQRRYTSVKISDRFSKTKSEIDTQTALHLEALSITRDTKATTADLSSAVDDLRQENVCLRELFEQERKTMQAELGLLKQSTSKETTEHSRATGPTSSTRAKSTPKRGSLQEVLRPGTGGAGGSADPKW